MPDELAQLEYERASALLESLTDIRFKLLAFVPTIAGAAVGLVGAHPRPAQLLGVGALGLTATAGVALYELHNTQLSERVADRLEVLERQLGLARLRSRGRDRSRARPLALVYAAALGGWAYLTAWGALAAAGAADARPLGGAAGGAAAVAVLLELVRREPEPAPAAPLRAAALPPQAPEAQRQ